MPLSQRIHCVSGVLCKSTHSATREPLGAPGFGWVSRSLANACANVHTLLGRRPQGHLGRGRVCKSGTSGCANVHTLQGLSFPCGAGLSPQHHL